MAIKAALAAALLVAMVAAGSATTTSYNDEGGGSQQCRQQLQGQEFESCQSYLRQGSSRPAEDPQQQQYVESCCQELKAVDKYQCGCEAIRRAAQRAQQKELQGSGSYQPGQSVSEQIYEAASELPRACALTQQQCRFTLAFY